MRMICAVVLGLIAVAAAGCDDDGVTTPTSDGVTLFTDTNFKGSSQVLVFNEPDLNDVGGPCHGTGAGGDWDDCASSIHIPAGWEVTLFEHDDYEGVTVTLTADVPDLHNLPGPCNGEWDDCISSIQLRQR